MGFTTFTTFPKTETNWNRKSSLVEEEKTTNNNNNIQTFPRTVRFKKNSISSLVEEQVNNISNNISIVVGEPSVKPSNRLKKGSISSLVEQQTSNPISNSNSSSNSSIASLVERRSKGNSISSLVEDQISSKRSKCSSISNLVEDQLNNDTTTTTTTTTTTAAAASSQPRFSMFGKKAKIEELNSRCLEQDKKAIEANKHLQKKRYSGKFDYYPSSTSSSPLLIKKHKRSVQFNPVFLERVCLFLENQSPSELKEAHDKQLSNPPFRIICSHWPSHDNTVIMLNKNTFEVSPDNKLIKGKLMIRNLALDKSALIRYTFDGWTSVRDADAIFFGPNPKNVAYDIYDFSMDLDHGQLADRGEMRGKLEFAVRCTMGDTDYWDNNDDKNYQIKIIADPLNDPFKHEQESGSDEDYDDDEEEDEVQEKHSQFATALKGYKHAKPYHLSNRTQPWLGTRYDFSKSLYLAKVAPFDIWTPSFHPDPSFIADCFPEAVKEIDLTYEPPMSDDTHLTVLNQHQAAFSDSSSPNLSPLLLPMKPPLETRHSAPAILSSHEDLEFNSTFYLNLLNKYCFYTSKDDNK